MELPEAAAVMDERHVWKLLLRHINDVLARSNDNNLRFLWVDDITPQIDLPQEGEPRTCATALVSENSGRSFETYRLTMSLGTTTAAAFRSREIDALIPKDSTDWLSVDRARKEIVIEFR